MPSELEESYILVNEPPVGAELQSSDPVGTPPRLTPKSASSGEAAGPPTPMQPQTAARRSPPGRSAEPRLQPEAASQVPVAPQQAPQPRKEQRQGRANRQQNPRQTPACSLNFDQAPDLPNAPNCRPRNGRRSPQKSPQRPAHSLNARMRGLHVHDDQWQPDFEMEEEYMWQRGHRQGGHFLNPRGEYNPEYNPGHQDVAWSGDVLPPYHIGEGPPPPQQPFQGGGPSTGCNQGAVHQHGMMHGYQPMPPPSGQYAQNGQHFVGYQGYQQMNRWMGSHHGGMNHQEQYGSPTQGAAFQQGGPMHMAAQQEQYQLLCEQQRHMHQQQQAYMPGPQAMQYAMHGMMPMNVPMQQYAGGQGSDYGGSFDRQQRSGHSGGHRGGPAHRRSISLPDGFRPDPDRVAPPPRHQRQISLPNVDTPAPRQQGGQQGRRGHRRMQSGRARLRSQGSSSSRSGRHSPARRPADLPAPAPGLTLQDVLKDLVKMCDNQESSRQVQALLAAASTQEMAAFVAGFVEHARVMEVIKDSFGNYVAQRLIEHADGASRLAIGRFLAPAVLDLSKHQYGCRVVQSAIQALPSVEAKAQLASQLKGKVLEYMLNSHGNHVIQCCIVSIPAAEDGHSIEFMLEELRDATLTLSAESLGEKTAAAGAGAIREVHGIMGVARHSYGCRVVQRIMEHTRLSGWKDLVCRQVVEHASELAETSFGNYVIQSCLALCSNADRDTAFINLMAQVGVLGFHKNASNVYERLIGCSGERCLTDAQLAALYGRLLADSGNRAEPGPLLDRLIPHQYGNYVVSSAMALMNKHQHKTVKAHIEAELRAIENNPKSTKQVKDRVVKLLGKASALLQEVGSTSTSGGDLVSAWKDGEAPA